MQKLLDALRDEINNMIITSPEKVQIAENIIIAIDNLSELLTKFNNK